MSKYKSIIYNIDRRDLLKLTTASASLMMMPNFDEAHAAGMCDKAVNEDFTNVVTSPNDKAELFYWIDGPMSNQFGTGTTNPIVRSKMAVSLDYPAVFTPDEVSYVEAYVLTDINNKIIAAQSLPQKQMYSPFGSYGIFDNLDINPNVEDVKVFVFIRNKKGTEDTTEVRVFEINKKFIRTSKLNYDHLSSTAQAGIPANFIADMRQSRHGLTTENELERGMITTQYANFASLAQHTVRSKLIEIKDEGAGNKASFKFEVDMMHNDLSDAHYMRYFLVLDPVGRVLGGLKRIFGEGSRTRKTQVVTQDVVNMTNTAFISSLALDIRDCPYVQVLTEDNHDAIARVTHRLR
ncbi:MAG: hypothetical protein HRU09_10630 [Oligoflexales bacterium]|nr:hypothetical protein [Oligoflexales bacterium]